MKGTKHLLALLLFVAVSRISAYSETKDSTTLALVASSDSLTMSLKHKAPTSPYELPYSMTGNSYDWHRLWMNTATLSGAFVGTLLVLEYLPEGATSWNRAELQDVPLFKRR